jgi:hypothetical protein
MDGCPMPKAQGHPSDLLPIPALCLATSRAPRAPIRKTPVAASRPETASRYPPET